MIVFDKVSATYPGFLIDDISFKLDPGQSLGIFGPSGIGKSTIIDMVLGFKKPRSGTITNTFKAPSVVFQDNRLVEELSIRDNIRAVSKNDPYEILRALDLTDFDKKAGDLSGGMKRRLALARALVYGGDLLILDEPFANLDEQRIGLSIWAIKKFSTASSTILVSHNRDYFSRLGIENILEL